MQFDDCAYFSHGARVGSTTNIQWLFLVPLVGGIGDYIIPQLAGKIPFIYRHFSNCGCKMRQVPSVLNCQGGFFVPDS